MLFSRYILWEDELTKTFNDITIGPAPQIESKSEETDLTVSLMSQDSYGNQDRKHKLARIRELQGQLSQYTNYCNSINFLFFLRKAITRIKDIVVEAFVSESNENNLQQKINEVGNVYGVKFKFKNMAHPRLLLDEIVREYQLIDELYASFYELWPLYLPKMHHLKNEISLLITQYRQESTLEYDNSTPSLHW
jgi:hypothetical protein